MKGTFLTTAVVSRLLPIFITALTLFTFSSVAIRAQNLDSIERGRTKDMLNTVKGLIKKNYYDPTYHGVDLDAQFKTASDKLDQAKTIGQALGIIAQTVMNLNDSHTIFSPPATNIRVHYGWKMQMLGDKCFVTAVKPKSDADAKGLKAGDQIISIEGFPPNRKEMWKINYYYYQLSPRAVMHLVVQSPEEKESRQIDVPSKIVTLSRVVRSNWDVWDLVKESEELDESDYNRFQKIGNTTVWKMAGFDFDFQDVDTFMRSRVAGSGNLILDLRDNGGGYVVTLERLAGYFFEKDMKIADLKGREEQKPQQAKSQVANVFKGRLIVLIDSNSASAAEIFARLIQLEKRGVIIGDQSAGAVMQSRFFTQSVGSDNYLLYGLNLTNADVIMSDGKSLENVGVTPDEKIIQTGADLLVQRDPALARALELTGQITTPEEAGKLFPIKWGN